jgi:hypothetical protein
MNLLTMAICNLKNDSRENGSEGGSFHVKRPCCI